MEQTSLTGPQPEIKIPSIVVLNLARRPERWVKWKREAERMALPAYQRWEAVDGQQLVFTPEIEYLFRNNDFHMRRGVIGCALSHMNIWLHLVEEQIPAMIVFEDDALFSEPFEVPYLPPGWDLFYYGGTPFKGTYPPGIAMTKTIIIPQLTQGLYFTTIGYMVSYSGAKKLLDRVIEIGFNKAVDWFMTDTFAKLNVFCYKRLRVYPDETSGSDVQDREL